MRYISLLRGINVSGQKKIFMQDLRDLYSSIGLDNVKSYIQSGNVIFNSKLGRIELISKIEYAILKKYNFKVKVFIRTSKEIKKILENNPYQDQDFKKNYILYLDKPIHKSKISKLNPLKAKDEEIKASSKEIYIYYHHNTCTSKLTTNNIEKAIDSVGTMRNLNTTKKLLDLSSPKQL